jgi:hypothetical protein
VAPLRQAGFVLSIACLYSLSKKQRKSNSLKAMEWINRVATGHCEERETRRGNLYKKSGVSCSVAIASSDALRVLLAMTGSNAVCTLPKRKQGDSICFFAGEESLKATEICM